MEVPHSESKMRQEIPPGSLLEQTTVSGYFSRHSSSQILSPSYRSVVGFALLKICVATAVFYAFQSWSLAGVAALALTLLCFKAPGHLSTTDTSTIIGNGFIGAGRSTAHDRFRLAATTCAAISAIPLITSFVAAFLALYSILFYVGCRHLTITSTSVGWLMPLLVLSLAMSSSSASGGIVLSLLSDPIGTLITFLRRKSTHARALEIRRYPNIEFPHVTIQMPVYKEGLKGVIIPTVDSLRAAIRHYEERTPLAGHLFLPAGERECRVYDDELRRKTWRWGAGENVESCGNSIGVERSSSTWMTDWTSQALLTKLLSDGLCSVFFTPPVAVPFMDAGHRMSPDGATTVFEADLAMLDKQPRLEEFVEIEHLVMAAKSDTETTTRISNVCIR